MSVNLRPCWTRHTWTAWRHVRTVDVYGDGWTMTELPTRRFYLMERKCRRCGVMKTKKVRA